MVDDVASIVVTDSPLTYQQSVLTEVVREATVQGLLPVEDCLEVQTRIAAAQSLEEIDQLWDTLSIEYRIMESRAHA